METLLWEGTFQVTKSNLLLLLENTWLIKLGVCFLKFLVPILKWSQPVHSLSWTSWDHFFLGATGRNLNISVDKFSFELMDKRGGVKITLEQGHNLWNIRMGETKFPKNSVVFLISLCWWKSLWRIIGFGYWNNRSRQKEQERPSGTEWNRLLDNPKLKQNKMLCVGSGAKHLQTFPGIRKSIKELFKYSGISTEDWTNALAWVQTLSFHHSW